MPRRWINSADVLMDDEGRLAVFLPAELIADGRLKVDAEVNVGDLELDASAITGTAPNSADLFAVKNAIASLAGAGVDARTLNDLYGPLSTIQGAIGSSEYGGGLWDSNGNPRLASLNNIQDYLYDSSSSTTAAGLLATIKGFLQYGGEMSAAELLNTIQTTLSDPGDGLPAISSCAGSLGVMVSNIFPAIDETLDGILAILTDVWDSQNHKLKVSAT